MEHKNPGLSSELQRKNTANYAQIKNTPEYAHAKSCVHCTACGDSFNNYVSTYCHLHQRNIYGFGKNELKQCESCEDYRRRK